MARRGANKLKGKAYRDANVRVKNKKRKLNKHIKFNANDKDAVAALKLVA